jgi:hypothetical protein
MYDASVGVFIPFLDNLSGLLDHAAAYGEARNIDPVILLRMRLAPTMYNLAQQVGEANRHAIIACALLAGHELPALPDAASDLAALKRRIETACEFVRGLPRSAIDGAAEKEVVFRFRNGAERAFSGRSLLLTFSVPQFFFHVTTAYDILRHAGVDLAKRDFLGPPRPVSRPV